MEGILGKELVAQGGSNVETAASFGDNIELVGIYFSAHWCPPCRGFTPTLADCYKTINANGKKFEIVFVSHDRDEASFADYFKDMPWLAIPFDSDKKEELASKFSVSGIPKLVLLNKDGSVKYDNGRGKIQEDTKGANFPW